MKKNPPKNYGVSEALREAGFVRLPAWWVTREELQLIHRIAHQHEAAVTRIRLAARMGSSTTQKDKTNE